MRNIKHKLGSLPWRATLFSVGIAYLMLGGLLLIAAGRLASFFYNIATNKSERLLRGWIVTIAQGLLAVALLAIILALAWSSFLGWTKQKTSEGESPGRNPEDGGWRQPFEDSSGREV